MPAGPEMARARPVASPARLDGWASRVEVDLVEAKSSRRTHRRGQLRGAAAAELQHERPALFIRAQRLQIDRRGPLQSFSFLHLSPQHRGWAQRPEQGAQVLVGVALQRRDVKLNAARSQRSTYRHARRGRRSDKLVKLALGAWFVSRA